MTEKKQYNVEIELNTSPRVLYPRLSTPAGLSEWFCDDVNLKNDIYTFIWKGTESKAQKIASKDLRFVRYQWLEDKGTPYYLEFKLETHELTGDVALHITDFANEGEEDEAIELWENQIGKLKRVLGI